MAKSKYKAGTKWQCKDTAEEYEILFVPPEDSRGYQEYLVKTTPMFSKGFKIELISEGLLDESEKIKVKKEVRQ